MLKGYSECLASLDVFDRLESEVRSYIRAFPTVFATARGPYLWDVDGRRYLDFFSGAGALNYGHNPPALRAALVAYIEEDGITHALDMGTVAKARFLEQISHTLLNPRGLEYRVMFPGPTGTNAVESALKLARKVTGRQLVIGFTGGFHGMTLGALAVSSNRHKRRAAGVPLPDAVCLPFDGYLGPGVDTVDYLEERLEDEGGGLPLPAAVIYETVQGEGGLAVAGDAWVARLAALCRRHGILLIADEVQVGCGRTGPFFSFERAGVRPDIVCLSKSISGYGLPLALTLIRPDIDLWAPGEHNGTFRGNNPAFVTGAAALRAFWEGDGLTAEVDRKAELVHARLEACATALPSLGLEVRGRGLIQGLRCAVSGQAEAVCKAAFARGLVIETSGASNQVIKLLPSLTIADAALEDGLDILEESLRVSA